jgi:hypothetical protein
MLLGGLSQLVTEGGTSHILPAPEEPPIVALGDAFTMIYGASSRYRVPIDILDLVVSKDASYFQRIHHGGVEIYYSTPSFLLTAGGIHAPSPNSLVGVSFPKDEGAPVTTFLMPTWTNPEIQVTPGRWFGTERTHFIRFDDGFPYTNNTCVYIGFACGLNPEIPNLYNNCRYDNLAPGWVFINSARCTFTETAALPEGIVGNSGPYFYVAIYEAECPPNYEFCGNSHRYGFLEAVDAPQAVEPVSLPLGTTISFVNDSAFNDFVQGVLRDNPQVFSGALGINLIGVYVTRDGHRIEFDPRRGEKDDEEWAILAIDGQTTPYELDDWQFLEGDILSSRGNAVITFTNPNRNSTIVFNMLDLTNPFTVPSPLPR